MFATYDRASILARNDHAMLRELIKQRKESGLTQTDVAEALGISQQAVSQFECLESDPHLSTIRQYANVVGVVINHGVSRPHEESEWHKLESDSYVVAVDSRQFDRGLFWATAGSNDSARQRS